MLICALASRYSIKSHLTSFTVYPMIDVSFAFFLLVCSLQQSKCYVQGVTKTCPRQLSVATASL